MIQFPIWLGWLVLGLGMVLYFIFLISLIFERENRAFGIGLITLVPLCALLMGYFLLPPSYQSAGSAVLTLVAVIVLICLIRPVKLGDPGRITGEMQRYDERDTILARWRYESGTEQYETYYTAHPEKKALDDDIRRRPRMFLPGGKLFDPHLARVGMMSFDLLHRLSSRADGPVAPDKAEFDPNEMSANLSRAALALGACHAGTAKLNPAFVYSHTGRGIDPWGKPIETSHKYALAFTIEMAYSLVRKSPHFETTVETGRRYVEGAVIANILAGYIRSLGYSARAHNEGSSYQTILPPIAEDAGIGEIGRMSILMTEDLGPRIRLGVVTTDMPLVASGPKRFGAIPFCEVCQKCAISCPSGAISKGPRETVNGAKTWKINPEACYRTWRILGTDCNVCMSVCPYSKPDTMAHRFVRAAIKRTAMARYVAVWADDLFYGRQKKLQDKR
ncbi:4Fe-4S dicluster domain-containing protein [Acidobacteriota bacterium]